ncbi:hypothetical protein RsoM2USA_125 [Ralstonia phage RsoM2USA]|nr:hypothetical protein RsoM2USA_125 [Ralstonia phage RsoM2USA]
MLTNIPHHEHCLFLRHESSITNIFNWNWKFKTAFCFVPQFTMTEILECYLLAVLNHFFDTHLSSPHWRSEMDMNHHFPAYPGQAF